MSHIDDDLFGADEIDVAEEVFGENAGRSGLEKHVALRDRRWTDLSARAVFARNNPPSILSGSLGNQVTVTTNTDPNGVIVPVQAANWVGDDAETGPVTVTLSPSQQPNGSINYFNIRPFGIVQFGTRGMSATVEVDIGLGCQFTISGSAVTVQLAADNPDGHILGGPVQFAGIGMLSFHPIVRTVPLYRTRYIVLANNVTPDVVAVPPFAKSLTVWRTNPGVADVQLFFLTTNGGGTSYTYTVAAGAYTFTPIPLSGDIAFIGTRSATGVGEKCRLIFELGV